MWTAWPLVSQLAEKGREIIMEDYKVAVYTICKDELPNVDKWMNSMLEADYLCVLDTGSTDGTWERILEWKGKYPDKIIVSRAEVKPWRFDVARNANMKLIPRDADFCISTDFDEVLMPGWGKAFREAWGKSNKHRMWYKYAWSHNADGTPARVFWYDKCHDNSGHWYWRFPVHETLTWDGADGYDGEGGTAVSDDIWLHHYPLHKDGRSSYLPLLEQRAKENPDDYYGLVYLAHEYYYQGKKEECLRFIDKTVMPAVSDKDMMYCKTDLYMFKGKCHLDLGMVDSAIVDFKQGIAETPEFRDNYLCLATAYIQKKRYADAVDAVNEALAKSRRLYSWLEWDKAWTSQPADLLCIAYYYMGAKHTSLMYAKLAHEEDKGDERLKDNLERLESELSTERK